MSPLLYGIITFYMLMVLVRWAAPWIRIDLNAREWAWIRYATDPVLRQARKMMPDMGGTMDWSFAAILVELWLVRMILTGR